MPRDVVIYLCAFLPDSGGACWDRECLLRGMGVKGCGEAAVGGGEKKKKKKEKKLLI